MKLSEAVIFNPTERLSKGTVAKKVGMDKLQPFVRDIPAYELAPYGGGAKFRNGDTIMARITPCLENGKTAFVNFLDDSEVGYGSTEFIVWRAKEGVTDTDYVYYLAQSPKIRDIAVKSMVGSSGRQRVQQTVLDNYEVDLPDIETQREIAATLRALDDKIAVNTKLNHNLEQMAQAIYGELYGIGRDGTLSELITVKYGKDHKKLADGSIPVYGSGGIMRFADTALYNGESVLIPRKGTLNNIIYINQPFWSVDTMFFTAMNRPNVAKFVYFFMKSQNLASMNSGSAVPSMTTEILNSLSVIIPPDDELARFEDVVGVQFEHIQLNLQENERLVALRDILLPKLMSGELAVSG